MVVRRSYTEDEKAILDGGIPIAMIARMFSMKTTLVRLKLETATPLGKRDGENIYRVRDVAKYLVDLPENVVEQVMRSNHMDLPPMLRKEFWIGQQSMLKVKELEGDLWRTSAVIDYVGEAFKQIRMAILLAGDTLERSTTLTDRQRSEVKAILDNLLKEIQERLNAAFSKRRRDEKGKPGFSGSGTGKSVAEQVADL